MNEILQERRNQIYNLANKLLGVKYMTWHKDNVTKTYEEYNIYLYLAEKDYADRSNTTHSIFKKIALKDGEYGYILYLHFKYFDGYDKDINADKLYEFSSTIEEWLKQDIDNKERG